MSETTSRAYVRASYTIDLSGLLAHARDTLVAYTRRATAASRDAYAQRLRSRVVPTLRQHADQGVRDITRIR
jgi:ribosome-binding factor A